MILSFSSLGLIAFLVLSGDLLAAVDGERILPPGVVVEEVGKHSAGEKAGIKPGDVLLSWERAASPPASPKTERGDFLSPLDLVDVEIGPASGGEIKISAVRSGRYLVLAIPSGWWSVRGRPQLSGENLSAYADGRALIEKKDVKGEDRNFDSRPRRLGVGVGGKGGFAGRSGGVVGGGGGRRGRSFWVHGHSFWSETG